MDNNTIKLSELETFGLSTQVVLKELEERFPPFNPTPELTQAQIMFRAGQRDVVEWINYRISEDYG